jgi:hypothetical protein
MKKFTVYILIMFAFPLLAYSQFTGGPGGGDISLKYENSPLAVSLLSFSSVINNQNVILNWSTEFENNNKGFDVERRTGSSDWVKIGNVKGAGTTSEPTLYSFTDNNLLPGEYNYRLKQMDYNNNFSYFELKEAIIINPPSKYNLSQNYPNPFNPITKIDFDLPVESIVMIVLYDITGREIKTILNESRTAGYYTIIFDGSELTSGNYFYKLTAGEYSATKKMVIIK